jgi:hypothetical protein
MTLSPKAEKPEEAEGERALRLLTRSEYTELRMSFSTTVRYSLELRYAP